MASSQEDTMIRSLVEDAAELIALALFSTLVFSVAQAFAG
jgi:hypothetical protein